MNETQIKTMLASLGAHELARVEGHPDADAYADAYGTAIVYADSETMREAIADHAWKGEAEAEHAARTATLPEGYRVQIFPWTWNVVDDVRGIALVNKLARIGVAVQPALVPTSEGGWLPVAF